MKGLVALALVSALFVVGCGGGNDSGADPKLSGKVESVPLPAGEKSPDQKLADAEKQRAAQAGQNAAGSEDKGLSEGGN
jgi:hypothetical protein